MNALKSLAVFLILLPLAFGCKSTPKYPQWVKQGYSDNHPKGEYLIGVGSGGDEEGAKENARAEIAKQFNLKISQATKILQNYTGMEGDKSANWILKTTITDLTSSFVEETVQGIEIAETWTDTKARTVYALAVLPRMATARRLGEQIADLDFQINELFNRSQKAEAIVSRIRPLVQAVELVKKRAILNNQLLVVSPVGSGIMATVRPEQLDKALNETLGALKVAIAVEGDSNNRVRNAIAQSLNKGKISVQPDQEGCDVLISGKVEAMETNPDNNTEFVFAKYRATLELKDLTNGSSFGLIEHEHRDGALNETDAKEKTLSRLSRKIVQSFNDKMYEYFSM